jgi:hypothetical protein
VPKDATARLVQYKLSKLVIGCNESGLVIQSFTGWWVYATNNDVSDFTFGMATNYMDCFD